MTRSGPRESARVEGVFDQVNRRAYELMRDGEWRAFDELLVDLGRFIPPGVAMRRYVERRKAPSNRPRSGAGTPRPDLSPDQKVASGRRTYIRGILHAGVAYEHDDHDRWRLVPDVVPIVVRSDEIRAAAARPILDALYSTFNAATLKWAAQNVQTTAHEFGFHLTGCPEGCELLPRPKRPRQVTSHE